MFMKYVWKLELLYSYVHTTILRTCTAYMITIVAVNTCKMAMCLLIWYIYNEKLFL
jgi:hypothetical protein